jgi:hypothetical protein
MTENHEITCTKQKRGSQRQMHVMKLFNKGHQAHFDTAYISAHTHNTPQTTDLKG